MQMGICISGITHSLVVTGSILMCIFFYNQFTPRLSDIINYFISFHNHYIRNESDIACHLLLYHIIIITTMFYHCTNIMYLFISSILGISRYRVIVSDYIILMLILIIESRNYLFLLYF